MVFSLSFALYFCPLVYYDIVFFSSLLLKMIKLRCFLSLLSLSPFSLKIGGSLRACG